MTQSYSLEEAKELFQTERQLLSNTSLNWCLILYFFLKSIRLWPVSTERPGQTLSEAHKMCFSDVLSSRYLQSILVLSTSCDDCSSCRPRCLTVSKKKAISIPHQRGF